MATTEQGSTKRGGVGLGRSFLYLVAGAGTIAAFARFAFGLGATTNLNDGYPWGLWITFDVLAGVALAAGGFTISAMIYVFNLKQFEPLLRPAKLSAFVGYVLAVLGIMFDIGFPWRIWHPIFMWNTSSVLFEVSWCVMVYTAVLGVDMLILLLEKRGSTRWVGLLRSVYVVAVVLGLILSALHQSSLGALFLVIPQKMSDLWATRALGPLFYASAVVCGLAVVILESLISARAYRRKPEMEILSSLAKGLAVALLVYFAMKVTDLYSRGVSIWEFDRVHQFFFLELFVTVALPAALLGFFPGNRTSPRALLWCAGLSAFGVVLNRFNVVLTAYAGYKDFTYFPSLAEVAVTVGLFVIGILVFDAGARYLPVYGGAEAPRSLTPRSSE
jgi:Ni/Fe-hydrogenase subunit HybB-like protein